MAVNVEQLLVELIAKTDKYVAGMEKAANANSRTTKLMQKQLLATEKSVKRFSIQGGAALRQLSAVAATALSTRELIRYSDTWNRVQNRLRIVTNTTTELNKATKDVIRVAKETRTGLEPTALLYSRMARSTKELNLTQKDLAEITATINKSFTISGATAAEASASIIQLSQAFSRGVLRGDEFRSVSEQAPEILRAVSAATGETRGELIKFAEQGALTSEVLIKSLKFYKENVDESFGKTKITIGQAFSVIETNITSFIGNINDATGASDTFTKNVIGMSEQLAGLEGPVAAGLKSITLWVKEWDLAFGDDVKAGLKRFTDTYGGEMELLVEFTGLAIDEITTSFVKMPNNISAALKVFGTELGFFEKSLKSFVKFGDESIEDFGKKAVTFLSGKLGFTGLDETQQSLAEINAEIEGNVKTLKSEREINLKVRNDMLAGILTERSERTAAFEQRIEQAKTAREVEAGGGGEEEDLEPIIDLRAEAEEALEVKKIERFLKFLDQKDELRLERDLNAILELETRLERETELLEAAAQREIITEEEKNQKIEQLTKTSEQIKAKFIQKAEDTIKQIRLQTLGTALNGLEALAGGSKKAAKVIFIAQQGLAAAEVFVSTQAASMRALAELGPIVGAPVAAAIEVKGAVSIAAILATAVGGLAGGGSSGGGLAIGTTSTASTNDSFVGETAEISASIATEEGTTRAPITFESTPGSGLEFLFEILNEAIRVGKIKVKD